MRRPNTLIFDGYISLIIVASFCHAYSGGDGTPENPYQIGSAQDLIDLGNEPNDYDKHFIMIADINLADYIFDRAVIAATTERQHGRGIIFSGELFSGSFHGQGYVIHNLQLVGDGPLGLFRYTDVNATIVSVGLENIDVNSIGDDVGSLVGYNRGSITSSYSRGTIKGVDYIGGLVGINARGTITSSYSMGAVTGERVVGGLAGINDGGVITRGHSICTVSGDYDVGGLVGANLRDLNKIWNGTITSSYSTGEVSGKRGIGGLLGSNSGLIKSCYSMSTVTGEERVGGLVGFNGVSMWAGITTPIFNVGTITSSYSTGTIKQRSPVDPHSSPQFSDFGGLVGMNHIGTITSCFWDIQTSGLTRGLGTGLTTVEMQDINTFLDVGWDFLGETINGPNDIWWMPEKDYPRLWWEETLNKEAS